jgi:hypothetical protein
MANVGMIIARREFRIFLHPMAAIIATGEQHGLKQAVERHGLFWQIAGMRRPV